MFPTHISCCSLSGQQSIAQILCFFGGVLMIFPNFWVHKSIFHKNIVMTTSYKLMFGQFFFLHISTFQESRKERGKIGSWFQKKTRIKWAYCIVLTYITILHCQMYWLPKALYNTSHLPIYTLAAEITFEDTSDLSKRYQYSQRHLNLKLLFLEFGGFRILQADCMRMRIEWFILYTTN